MCFIAPVALKRHHRHILEPGTCIGKRRVGASAQPNNEAVAQRTEHTWMRVWRKLRQDSFQIPMRPWQKEDHIDRHG